MIMPSFHDSVTPVKNSSATETTSGLETRGYYDMPSDSIRSWPVGWDKPFTIGNADNTVSAYDNVSATVGFYPRGNLENDEEI